MSDDTPLNLGSIDPPLWRVTANDDVYGPYTLGQMRALIDEGRVISTSKVSRGPDGHIMPAVSFQELSSLLPEPAQTESANFVIIARTTSSEPVTVYQQVARVLDGFGVFAETLPGTYILNATHRLADIRAALNTAVDSSAQILIVEAPNGRLGWLGLSPELDRHIRQIWKANPK